MKIISLGQAGLMIENEGSIILIDPYLSNNVEKFEPQNKRKLPINESLFSIKPSCLIFTHCHLDHYDIETIKKYENLEKITTFSPLSVFKDIATRFQKFDNKLVSIGDSFKIGSLEFKTIKAYHSDPEAVGYILNYNGKNIYIVGDSLYKDDLVRNFAAIDKLDYMFVPVNGYGNNMNALEADKLAKQLNARVVIPYHYGMFDDIKFKDLNITNKKELKIYQSLVI